MKNAQTHEECAAFKERAKKSNIIHHSDVT